MQAGGGASDCFSVKPRAPTIVASGRKAIVGRRTTLSCGMGWAATVHSVGLGFKRGLGCVDQGGDEHRGFVGRGSVGGRTSGVVGGRVGLGYGARACALLWLSRDRSGRRALADAGAASGEMGAGAWRDVLHHLRPPARARGSCRTAGVEQVEPLGWVRRGEHCAVWRGSRRPADRSGSQSVSRPGVAVDRWGHRAAVGARFARGAGHPSPRPRAGCRSPVARGAGARRGLYCRWS